MTAAADSHHPVLELLSARAREGSRPQDRSDGARLGLVIEGGCMRGVVSGGMALALERLGLRNAFDAVYGSSAGAVNGAFFVAGQVEYGIDIYFKDINNARFIALSRSLVRRPAMSLSYLLDDVMVRRRILDWRSVLDSPVPLKIAATSVADLGVRLLQDFRDRDHLFAALRASSSIPMIAGPPSEVDGEFFLDALLYEPIPYRSALADGCSHVLVLLTRPEGTLAGRTSLFERHVIARWIHDLEPQLRLAYLRQLADYDLRVAELQQQTAEPQGPPHLCALSSPRSAPAIRWLEKKVSLLRAAAAAGEASVRAALDDNGSPSGRRMKLSG